MQFRNYLDSSDYEWRYEPKGYKQPPDFLVIRKNGNVLCEIKTLEAKNVRFKVEKLAKNLGDRLKKIKRSFYYDIFRLEPSLQDKDLKRIGTLINSFLKKLNVNTINFPVKFIYSGKEKKDARKFVIIRPEISQGLKVRNIVSIESEEGKYPVDIGKVGILYNMNFTINYLDEMTETKNSYEMNAWDTPLAEIMISRKGKKPYLYCTSFFYGVHEVTNIKDTRNKIKKSYEKFKRLKKLPGIVILFSKRLILLDFESVFAAIRGDPKVKIYKNKQGKLESSSLFFQGNAMLQPKKNRNISAIVYFDPIKTESGKKLRYTVFHNYWAKNPLDLKFFRGKYDRQFVPQREYRGIYLKCMGYCK